MHDIGTDLVNDEQISLCNTGPTFARDLVAACDIDHVDCIVCKLIREVGREIIATRFAQKYLRSGLDAFS